MKELLNKVHQMDCLDFLKLLPDNSIDSCVTDPPYGLQFMGIEWDRLDGRKGVARATPFDTKGGHHHARSPQDSVRTKLTEGRRMQEWHYQWAVEILRVLKPGSHILAFSGARTYHRLACAIEDAGFEVRDQIHWLYGSGFPKGMNIAKAIDKRIGSKGKKVGEGRSGKTRNIYEAASGPEYFGGEYDITEPESDLARSWEGWNTHLKPAHEPIVLARKTLSEKTIVDNVLKHGTAGLNIDGCRITTDPEVDDMDREVSRKVRESPTWEEGSGFKNENNVRTGVLPSGRYPANLILSHHPDCELIQEGNTKVTHKKREATETTGKGIYADGWLRNPDEYSFDAGEPDIWNCVEGCPVRTIGEPARFFYCAKPSDNERNKGLKGERNLHITVKPLEIMRWLIRLITPPDGIVLDPFLGSGTTAIAAENEGFDWVGSEISEEYCKIARLRIESLGGTQMSIDDF